MQFSGNFSGKPPILSKLWALAPPWGQNSTGSWIRAWHCQVWGCSYLRNRHAEPEGASRNLHDKLYRPQAEKETRIQSWTSRTIPQLPAPVFLGRFAPCTFAKNHHWQNNQKPITPTSEGLKKLQFFFYCFCLFIFIFGKKKKMANNSRHREITVRIQFLERKKFIELSPDLSVQ